VASPAQAHESLLTTHGLSAFYGPLRALESVTLDVPAARVTALLGANGAGKTTLLRALCAMVRTRGEVWFDGERIDAWRTDTIARAGVAHVPEGRGTFVSLTVEENLMAASLSRRASHEARGRSESARAELVYRYFPRLAERRRQRAGQLSGGEQQMLAIGRALMLAPRLLLVDEPSFGLAPLLVAQVFEVLHTATRDEGLTTLLVEQNAHLALGIADQACVLHAGRLVFTGTADDVRRDPALRRAYLGG
jgi:branched-chain amino acid transport system ATP-binding protein